MRRILVFSLLLACAGCTMVKPLKPGTARIQSGGGTNGVGGFVSEIKQPENPAQSATPSGRPISLRTARYSTRRPIRPIGSSASTRSLSRVVRRPTALRPMATVMEP